MSEKQQADVGLQPKTIPAVFISHGSPMVALQSGPHQDALAEFGRSVRPSAIVAISAHWSSDRTIGINGAARHITTHDFGGFPSALYELTYNAPGSPELAGRIADLLREGKWKANITIDRGLDHGVWSPLRLIFPSSSCRFRCNSLPKICIASAKPWLP